MAEAAPTELYQDRVLADDKDAAPTTLLLDILPDNSFSYSTENSEEPMSISYIAFRVLEKLLVDLTPV
jgi:hypothetical protein